MVKAIAGSIVVVLLVSSGAVAQINVQTQNWGFGLTNDITMDGGPGGAETTQGIGTISVQNIGINPDMGGTPTVVAAQGVGVALFQTGAVQTDGAPTTLDQDLAVTGAPITIDGVGYTGQVQMVGDLSGPTVQFEGATVVGSQNLSKEEGSNAATEGLNVAVNAMGQTASNNCAEGCQGSVIIGGSFSALEGAAQSEGTVNTTMTATVTQLQIANNEPVVGP